MALRKTVNEEDLRPRRISPFLRGDGQPIGGLHGDRLGFRLLGHGGPDGGDKQDRRGHHRDETARSQHICHCPFLPTLLLAKFHTHVLPLRLEVKCPPEVLTMSILFASASGRDGRPSGRDARETDRRIPAAQSGPLSDCRKATGYASPTTPPYSVARMPRRYSSRLSDGHAGTGSSNGIRDGESSSPCCRRDRTNGWHELSKADKLQVFLCTGEPCRAHRLGGISK